jgi:hypothetical protein
MLVTNSYVVVVRDVKAGQTVDIAQESSAGNLVYQSDAVFWDDIFYSFISYRASDSQEMAAALYAGVALIKQQTTIGADQVIVAGAARDYDGSTAGGCEETSYGCLYTVAEQEVSDAAD